MGFMEYSRWRHRLIRIENNVMLDSIANGMVNRVIACMFTFVLSSAQAWLSIHQSCCTLNGHAQLHALYNWHGMFELFFFYYTNDRLSAILIEMLEVEPRVSCCRSGRKQWPAGSRVSAGQRNRTSGVCLAGFFDVDSICVRLFTLRSWVPS